MSTHNLCFEQKYEKYQNFYLKIFIFGGRIFSIFELACFPNGCSSTLKFYGTSENRNTLI